MSWWWWNDRGGAGRALGEIAFPGIDITATGRVAYRDFESAGEVFFDEGTDATFTAQG